MNGTFSPIWEKLIALGRKIEPASKGVANTMTADQLQLIKESIVFVVPEGVSNHFEQQFDFDMKVARYRLYDALGMAMGGRWGEDPGIMRWVDKVVKTYIGCVEEKKVKTRNELYDCVGEEVYK